MTVMAERLGNTLPGQPNIGPLPAYDPYPPENSESINTRPWDHAIDSTAAYAQAYGMLEAQFGRTTHRYTGELPTPQRARIMGTGTAGTSGKPENYTASAVNPDAGALALASSVGVQSAAIAAAHGFVRQMDKDRVAQASVKRAAQKVGNTLNKIIPAVLRKTVPAEHPLRATAQAAQIVGDQLLYAGRHTAYVYSMDTGLCARLQEGGRSHTLSTGRTILVMTGDRLNDGKLSPIEVAGYVQDALAESSDPSGVRRDPAQRPEDQADRIAHRLHRTFATNHRTRTPVMVSMIDLQEAGDKRPAWVRGADRVISAPAVTATNALRRMRALKDRAVYEAGSHTERMNRLRLRLAGVAIGAAVLSVGYAVAREGLAFAGVDLPHLTDFMPHHGVPQAVPPHTTETTNTAQTHVDITQPLLGPSANVTKLEPTPFADTYTAQTSDGALTGHATTVTGISQVEIRYYGTEMGLSADQINALVHDPDTINKLNSAFMHDAGNPHNLAVLHDRHHWLNAGDTYSTHNQAQLAQQIVADRAKQLGIEPPQVATAPPADTAITPPAINTPPDNTPAAGPDEAGIAANHQRNETIGLAVAGTAVSLLFVGGWWASTHRARRDRLRARLEEEIASGAYRQVHGWGTRANKLVKAGLLRRDKPNPALIGTTPPPPGSPIIRKQRKPAASSGMPTRPATRPATDTLTANSTPSPTPEQTAKKKSRRKRSPAGAPLGKRLGSAIKSRASALVQGIRRRAQPIPLSAAEATVVTPVYGGGTSSSASNAARRFAAETEAAATHPEPLWPSLPKARNSRHIEENLRRPGDRPIPRETKRRNSKNETGADYDDWLAKMKQPDIRPLSGLVAKE